MNEITLKYMQKLSKITINDRGNFGIVYHGGNVPAGIPADQHQLTGDANGNTVLMQITQDPNTTANQVIAAMQEHIRQQARVRNMRYRHQITGNASPAGVKLDVTGISMTSILGVLSDMGDIAAPFKQGDDISLDTFTDYYDKLYQRYVATYRGAAQLVDYVVCHGSCHSSCHYARGRR